MTQCWKQLLLGPRLLVQLRLQRQRVRVLLLAQRLLQVLLRVQVRQLVLRQVLQQVLHLLLHLHRQQRLCLKNYGID